jgi:hypothetical protein
MLIPGMSSASDTSVEPQFGQNRRMPAIVAGRQSEAGRNRRLFRER